jgi:Transposase C of IS166 homeodomain
LLLLKAVKGLSKKQLLKENQELREENARLRQEIELLRQKMDLLIRRVFGRSSEKLDADQLDLFLMAPENEPGKVDASSLEEADPGTNQEQGVMPAAGSDGLRTCRLLRRSSIPRKCRRRQRIGA